MRTNLSLQYPYPPQGFNTPALKRSLWLTWILPLKAVGAESVSASGGEAGYLVLLISALAAVAAAALIIMVLALWSRKQDHIGEMLLFCLKYLVGSENEAERCASAKALGRVKDPGAMLVLVDVTMDEEESEPVRKAAAEALHEMGQHFRKNGKIIAELEQEAEQGDLQAIIQTLITNFERGDTRYVQSAYIIGRHYMRLGQYLEAREWLTKAESRSRKFNLYGNRIRHWIDVCNIQLLEEADEAYRVSDYHLAKEHYAVLSHGLNDVDRQRCAVYLRSACVYCKLKDFHNADQALLQALEHNHETELALLLVPSVQRIQGERNEQLPQERLEEVESLVENQVGDIMETLLPRAFNSNATLLKS